jgi:hypothetical protein
VSVASSSLAAARGAGRTLDWLYERPRTVVGALIVSQIAATVVLALSVAHNGWVYFQGGDQIVNTTTGWLLGMLEIPPTEVGYLWPLAQTPVTWLTGPTFVQALPAIVALNVLVLGPVATLCVYGIASRVGGRLLGYWAAALWVVAPFVAILLFDDRYHEKWVEQFLPQALGLTAMPDYPSMVAVLAAAFLVVRSLTGGGIRDAVLAGLLVGAAGGLKPANYIFAIAAVLAYPVARRWREVLVFAIAVAPSVLILAYWKERGLGIIPALPTVASDQVRLAVSASAVALEVDFDRYFDFDLQHWRDQMDQLREFFWSPRVAQWAPFAGLLAVLRVRRGAIAVLLGSWLGAFIVVKGFSPRASIETNTFWRLLMPAWPAYLLLFASIPLLVPTLAQRLGDRVRPPARSAPIAWRWVGLAAVLVLAVPTATIAASERMEPPTPAIVQTTTTATTILTPVDDTIHVQVENTAAGRRLTWQTGPWRANVFYRVYRADDTDSDVDCVTAYNVAWECILRGVPIATTRDTEFVDTTSPPNATYRIGVGTNWLDDPEQGDIFDFSPPVSVLR